MHDASPAPSAPAPATEQVLRPAGGLARGVWEAPPAAFYAAGTALFVACLLYAARRAGFLRRGRARHAAGGTRS